MKKKIKLNLNKKTISNLGQVFGGTGPVLVTRYCDDTLSVPIGPCPDPTYTCPRPISAIVICEPDDGTNWCDLE